MSFEKDLVALLRALLQKLEELLLALGG